MSAGVTSPADPERAEVSNAEIALSVLELRMLLDPEGANDRGLRVLGLAPIGSDLVVDAYDSLSLRGLARLDSSGPLIAPQLGEVRSIMMSASTVALVAVAVEDSETGSAFFDGDVGRIAVSPSAIPGCRTVTKLVSSEPLGDAVARLVRAIAPDSRDAVAVVEMDIDGSTHSVAIRRRDGEVERRGDVSSHGVDAEIVDAIIEALSDPRSTLSD